MNHPEKPVLVSVDGRIGYLTLNRPRALNALTLEMVDTLQAGLDAHVANAAVQMIVIRSSSERAFCAGGDMKAIRQWALEDNYAAGEHFFSREYALNLAIARCPKPYIALLDGVTMGGGIGVSVHGQYRLATEHAVLAMPETRIGFFPDVGASYFLPRLKHAAGHWLALTAASVTGTEAVVTGLATHRVDRQALPGLLQELTASTRAVDDIIEAHAVDASNADFEVLLRRRGHWFEPPVLDTIRERLTQAADQHDDAREQLVRLNTASPFSVHATLELFQSTRGKSLDDCLAAELELTRIATRHTEFIEGVRAVLVDKDHAPSWLNVST